MEGSDRVPWFVGDLDDPWVVAIADAVPLALRLHRPGELSDAWPIGARPPASVILHRPHLAPGDAHRVVGLRSRWEQPPRTILCVGPQARYEDVERWSRLVEVVIPEATAAETIARHVFGPGATSRAPGHRRRVAVVSTDHELRAALADVCRSGGHPAEPLVDWADLAPGCPIVWDVPVLEDGWAARLAQRAETSPVIALLGFADRATVSQARAAGASACLELPCDAEDLIAAVDRVSPRRVDPAHALPAPFVGKTGGFLTAKTPRSPR